MASPKANRVANTFPETVIIRAIANDAKLAKISVRSTEAKVTKMLFRKLTSKSLSLSNLR